MSQVRRALGELGGISITERRKADGSIVYVARAKGRRLDGRDVSVEATGPSRRAAEKRLRERWETRREERQGQTPPPRGGVVGAAASTRLTPTSTMADVALAWLAAEENNPRTRAQSTKRYRSVVTRHIIPALGQITLAEMNAGIITEWLRDLRASPTPSVVEAVVGVLHRISKFAAQRGLVRGDFLFGVEVPPKVKKENPSTRDTVTPEEARTVLRLADARSPRLGLVMRIIAETGARPGEVLALHRGQLHPSPDAVTPPYIELHGTVIYVTGQGALRQAESKTSTSHRRVAVTPETMDRLLLMDADSRRRFPEPDPLTGLHPTIPAPRGGWWRPARIPAQLGKALAGTEVEGVTPVTFRHTVATAIADRATDLAAANLLGHARPAMTGKHYIRPGLVVHDGTGLLADYLGSDTAG